MKSWSVILALFMLAGTWILQDLLFVREPILARKPFSAFPLHLNGRWRGEDVSMTQATLDNLKADDYMQRIYSPVILGEFNREGEKGSGINNPPTMGKNSLAFENMSATLPVSFYAAYHKTQHMDSAYHSPKSCLPGSGWQIINAEYQWISLPQNQTIQVNVVLIQKGLDQQLVVYWYQDRGKVIANEYWAKARLIWDAAIHGRRDGALLRIIVPIIKSKEQALNQAQAFILDVTPFLDEYIPA